MRRRKNKNMFALLLIVTFIVISAFGIKFITDLAFQPGNADAAHYTVYQDQFVKVSIIYTDKNKVADDGTTFISQKGHYSNDILLVVENLRTEGLIFTPTPVVTIVNDKGNIVEGLKPHISVAGIANSEDSTYISFTNPVPDYSTKTGTYSYAIDMQYQYIFYDRVNNTEQVSLTIYKQVINANLLIVLLRYAFKGAPYIAVILLSFVVFKGRK